MKKLFTVLLGVAAFTCLMALPPANAKDTTAKAKTVNATHKGPKTTTMEGMVGADGRSFVRDKDKASWEVGNPEALKGDAGQHVRIEGQVDSTKGVVTVQSATVEPAKPPKSKTNAKKST